MPNLLHLLGSKYRVVKLAAGTMAFNKNGVTELEVPNSLLQKNLILRLTGNLVIGVANATIFSEAPLGLIKKIELVGDSRRYLCVATGRELYTWNRFAFGKQPELTPPSGTVGTRAFSATLRIQAEAIRMVNPVESLFDPRLYKKVILRITWGDETSISTAGGGGGTIAIDAATAIAVHGDYTTEGVSKILFDHVFTRDEKPVLATSSNFFLDIPQNGLLAGVLIHTDRDAGAGAGPVPVDDIVNKVSLVSDATIRHTDTFAWASLQRDNVLRYQLDGGATAGAQIPGWAYLPLHENGMFSSMLNLNALNKAQLIFDVTFGAGTQTLAVLYEWFEPRRNLAQEVAAAVA